MNDLYAAAEPPAALGNSSTAQLVARLSALEGRIETLSKVGSQVTDERNARMVVEADLESHMARLEEHERASDVRIGELEAKVRSWHDEIVADVSTEMDSFTVQVVRPLEEEVRRVNDAFPDMKREVEDASSAANDSAAFAEQMNSQGQQQLQALEQETQSAITQLAAKLGGEQRDHAEAITNLMDMVERTATQEELSAAMDGIAGELEARTNELETSVGMVNERCAGVERELERAVQELASVVDEQVAELDGRLSGAIEKLTVEVGEEVTHLQEITEAKSLDLSSKIAALSDDLQLRANELTRRCAAVEETTGSFASAKSREDMVVKISLNMQSLDAKMENTAQVLHQKVELTAEEMDRQLDACVTSVDAKLAKGARDAAARSELAAKEMQQDFAEEKTLLDSEVSKVKDTIERQEKRMLSTLSDDAKVASTRLKVDLASVKTMMDDRIGTTVSKVDRQLEEATRMMDDSNTRVDEMALRVTQSATENSDRTAEATSRLEELRKQIESQILHIGCTAASSLQMEVAKLEAEVTSTRASSHNAMERLERKCSLDTDATQASIEARFEKVKDSVDILDRKIGAKWSTIETSVTDQHAHFTAQFTATESRTKDKDDSMRSTLKELADTVNVNQRSTAAAQTQMESKFDERLRHYETQLESRCTALTEGAQRLDLRLSEQKEQTADLVRDRAAALVEQIQGARTYMNDRYSQLDQHYSASQSEFEDKLLQKQTSMETRLDQALATLRTLEMGGTRTDAELERVNATTKDLRDHFSKLHATMEKTVEEQRVDTNTTMDDVKGRLAQNFAHFTNLIGSLEAKTTTIETKIMGTTQSIADTRDKYSGLCNRLETEMREDNRMMTDVVNDLQTKVTTVKTETDQKLQSMKQQVVDGNLNLDSKFVGKFAAFEQRANDQHESSMEKISMVEVTSAQKEAGYKKRFEDLESLLNERTTEFATMCGKVDKQSADRESRTEDVLTELATLVDKNRRDLQELCAEVEKRNVGAMQSLEEQIAQQQDNFMQMVAKAERNIEKAEYRLSERDNGLQSSLEEALAGADVAASELKVVLTGKLEDLEESVLKDHNTFTAELERLGLKASDESKSIVRRFTPRMTALNEKIDKIADDDTENNAKNAVVVEELDQKYEDMHRVADERMKNQNEVLSELMQTTRTELILQDEALEVALRGQHEHFTAAVTDLSERHDIAVAEIEDRSVRTDEEVERVEKSFSTVCSELIDELARSNTQHAQANLDVKQQLDRRAETIEGRMQEEDDAMVRKHTTHVQKWDIEVEAQHSKNQELERADAALLLEVERKSIATDAAVGLVQSQAEGRHRAQVVRVEKLESDVTGKLLHSVEELEGSINRDLKPLMTTVDEIGVKLVSVGDQAATADGTATKLSLLVMDVEAIADAIKALDEKGQVGEKEFGELSARVDAVGDEVNELSTDLTMLETAAMVEM